MSWLNPLMLGEYLPDKGPLGNPGLMMAAGCLPYQNHYRSLASLADYSINGLGGTAKGFISTRDQAGNAYAYAADKSALYRLAASTFYDATRASGGAYSTEDTDNWEFVQWGDEIVATNRTDAIQSITMGSSNFAALAGSPPKARHMAVVGNFLVLGNVTDISAGGSAVANRIHWSGYRNINTWAVSASTQCDYQDLEGGHGWVQRIIGGEVGIIFQEGAIRRMTYIGPPVIYQIDIVEENRGTPAPNSVILWGGIAFYLGQDDFYRFMGTHSEPIGTDRVYKTFLDDLDSNYYHKIFAAADPAAPFIFWAYPGAGNVNGLCNKALVYNPIENKWAGPIEFNVNFLANVQSEGYTLDGLDAVSTSIDLIPYTLDSREWMGKTLNFAGFSAANKLQMLTGNDYTATFQTGDHQLFPGKRALVTNLRPIVEGVSASISMAVSRRNLLNESASFGASISMNAHGECPQINEGRYHRFQTKVKNGFTHARGMEIQAIAKGRY